MTDNNHVITDGGLWEQTIDIASRRDPRLKEMAEQLNHVKDSASRRLLSRLKQLNLSPDLEDDPIAAIVTIYNNDSPVYRKYNMEAFRIPQAYFYYHLLNIDKFSGAEADGEEIYTFGIGMQAVRFADIAECHTECPAIAEIMYELFETIKHSPLLNGPEDEMYQQIENGLFLAGFNSMKAASATGQPRAALDWAVRAEPYVSSTRIAYMRSAYFAKRGDVLLALGKAEEALTWFEKAVAEPGLTREEITDYQRQLDFAKHKITGDPGDMFEGLYKGLPNDGDIEELKRIFDSAMTGGKKTEIYSRAMELVEKYFSGDSLETLARNTSLKGIPSRLAKLRSPLITTFAREAMSRNDIPYVENLIPEIEQLAEGDSFANLDAAFFLARFQHEKGERVTLESISALVSRLRNQPHSQFLSCFIDLLALVMGLDEEELIKTPAMIAELVKEFTFDEGDDRTPAAVVQNTAFRMDIIDSFLALLVVMSQIDEANAGWWLEHIARLKYRSGYCGQRLQKGSGLSRFSSQLPGRTARRIWALAEVLTESSLKTKGKRNADDKEKEIELMTLLYPLYQQYRPSQGDEDTDTVYPEIIHIETANYLRVEHHDAPVVSVGYTGDHWTAYFSEVTIDENYARFHQGYLKHPVHLAESINVGTMLRKSLFPIPGDSTVPSLIGVRSTGIYHRIPLDSLPLSVDEQTGKVTRWVGEQTVSVLLSGPNRDLSALEKPLNMERTALFANSDFDNVFPGLTGTVNETKAIEAIVKAKTGASPAHYLESNSNRDNFLRLSGENAPHIIHVATHGILDEKNPASSFIALSGKDSRGNPVLGAVGYHDIMLMDLRQCGLVVLSACSTHEGKSIMGEGIMGLAWAFKAAGAGAVIGTRWPMDDGAAVEFWKRFYENLCGELSIADAFRDARRYIMKQEQWSHPYYWGVFQLMV